MSADPAPPPVPASAPPEVRMAAGMAYTDNEGYGTRLAFDAAFDVAYAAGVATGRTAAAADLRAWQRQTRKGSVVDDVLDIAARIAEGEAR